MDEWVSIRDVYLAYLDCRHRKRGTQSCAEFEINEAANLYQLWEDLNNGTYKIGYSIAFCVTRPKVREVFAADFRDRIVHHLVMMRTMNLFEDYFIEETYNCRKGKGTAAAHKKALDISLEYADGWVLNIDIQGFFMSIPKHRLADRLEAFLRERYKGKDMEQVVWLSRMIALHHPERMCIKHGDVNLWRLLPPDKSLFTCGEDLGMAIGNLTSQEDANFYLSPFDHWMKRQQGIGYCRYVDDARIFANDKQTLLRLIPMIRAYLKDQDGLTLHPRKISLQQTRKGFTFVGAGIKGGRLYTGDRTVGNCWNMVDMYNNLAEREQEKSVTKFVQRYNSYAGYMVHYHSYTIRYKMWQKVGDTMKRFVYIEKRMGKIVARTEYNHYQQLKKEYYDLRKHPEGRIRELPTLKAA